MQILSMPYAPGYHQSRGTIPWQSSQPVFGNSGPGSQPMYPRAMGTPVASSNAYNSQMTYSPSPSSSQYEGVNGSHRLVPMHNLPHVPTYSSQPGHMAAPEFYISQHRNSSGPEITQPCPPRQSMPFEDVQGQSMAGGVPPVGRGNLVPVPDQSVHATADARGGSWSSRCMSGGGSDNTCGVNIGPFCNPSSFQCPYDISRRYVARHACQHDGGSASSANTK